MVDGGRVGGVLTRGDLLIGLAKQGQLALVADLMQRNVCKAEAGEMVESVLARLHEDDCKVLPVTENGELVGILTTENLGEYMMIQTALGEAARGKRPKRPAAASPRETWVS